MIKRLFDVLISGVGIVILVPIFIFLSFCIKITSKGPFFFKQMRVGRNGRIFYILKFRTMVDNTNSNDKLITSFRDNRVTKCGNILRRYKLDEIPQLINVFFGDMSLVGPRPEVPKYVDLFKNEYKQLLSVRPGMTDPASLKFKMESSLLDNAEDAERIYLNKILPEKIRLSKEYLEKRTFLSDFKVILLTITGVF